MMRRFKLIVLAIFLPLVIAACAPQAGSTPLAPGAATSAPTSPTAAATTAPAATSATTAVATASPSLVGTPTAAATTSPSLAGSPTAAATTAPALAGTPTAAMTAAATAAASPVTSSSGTFTIQVAKDPKLGTILVDSTGMTLYLYANDKPNVSTCVDQCAQNWPPLVLTTGQPSLGSGLSGTVGTITRADGSTQVTYNGMPLYHFAKDAKPGDTTGNGVGSVWTVAQPGAAQPAASTSGSTSG